MPLFFGRSCFGHAGHMAKEGQVGLEMYKRSLEKWSKCLKKRLGNSVPSIVGDEFPRKNIKKMIIF